MAKKSKEVNLGRYWPFWGLHFGFHMMIGLLASIAGLVVIFTQREILNGLALVGAGSFAIINSWQGFKELGNNAEQKLYINSKERNQ